MISWNRIFIILGLYILAHVSVSAQNVYYYKLTKSKIDGIVSSNVSGGQFICIYDGVCFDCDINGNGIGNGQLNKKSEGEFVVYFGDSYYGNSSYYKFDKTFSKLNVISSNGEIYAYVKTTPPKGVTTSTLIKKHYNGGNGHSSSNYDPIIDIEQSNNLTNTNSDNNSQNGNRPSNNPQKRKCVYCNGTGQITKNDDAPANFGTERPRQRCSTCGEWYNPNVFTHYHIRCRHCGGTGFSK